MVLMISCVTGWVSNCGPAQTCYDWSDNCVFGDEWYTLSSAHLMVVGNCSDGQARKILLGFDEDSSSNSAWTQSGTESCGESRPLYCFED